MDWDLIYCDEVEAKEPMDEIPSYKIEKHDLFTDPYGNVVCSEILKA